MNDIFCCWLLRLQHHALGPFVRAVFFLSNIYSAKMFDFRLHLSFLFLYSGHADLYFILTSLRIFPGRRDIPGAKIVRPMRCDCTEAGINSAYGEVYGSCLWHRSGIFRCYPYLRMVSRDAKRSVTMQYNYNGYD